jgi:KamA family protein
MSDRAPPQIRFFSLRDLDRSPLAELIPAKIREAMRPVAHVLPFRANNYLVEELIDWSNLPRDPMFQLTFPQPDMLGPDHRWRMSAALRRGGAAHIRAVAEQIRLELNPHPAGQLTHNVPTLDDERVPGLQHKYAETCLVFPSVGQTCHAFCTFCFRWAQFVGMRDLKFATDRSMRFFEYLRRHDEVSDVLFTGGDPMVMSAKVLARYVEPLLAPEFGHIQTIRFGTKALAYWPHRFLTDDDTAELLRLLERIVASGKHLAVMAHFVHVRELRTPAVRLAMERLRALGAVIRTQAPLVRHVNDDPRAWAEMWKEQVRLGLVPYYMFVERDTGASRYFRVPLDRALTIYRQAVTHESGLARTARGPTMSALPGKVTVDGITEINGKRYFVLSFLQARNPDWCRRPFLAEFDADAAWLSDLRPAFDDPEFFYERDLREMYEPAGLTPSTEDGWARAAA